MHLEAQHLSFGYIPEQTVLHDISLSLKAGEILYILGRNGGGKTTLLSCLAGLILPDTGRVLIDGKLLTSFSTAERAKLIGLIPQMHIPSFAYSVEEMVLMGRAPHLGWLGSPSRVDYQIVEEALEQVGLFEMRKRAYTEISGGEQQLVLIARGLAQKCQVLLMDEPTAHLDLSNQHRVLEIIQQLSQRGLSFIISSHAPNDALAYADNVLLLTGGWATDYGLPKEVLTESRLSAVYGIQTEVIYQSENGRFIPRAVVPRRPERIRAESLYDHNSFLSQMFVQRDNQPRLLLVTGLSGAGKTTWCTKLARIAKEKGLTVRGILSPGVFKGQRKMGIGVQNLATGEERLLATLNENDYRDLSTPRWTFDAEQLKWANDILADIDESDLLIIDELGPLEFLRGEGLTAALEIIDQKRYHVACVVVRSSLLPKVLQRWPDALVVSGDF